MNVRALLPTDRPFISRILEATGVFSEEEIRVALELVDSYLTQAEQRDYRLFCAVDGADVPTGYVCFGPTPLARGTFDLYWIAVDPRHQGRGIGRELWAFVEKQLAFEGGRLLLIETSSQPVYAPTHRFYLSMGCCQVARIPDFYSPGDDRVIYSKKLHGVSPGSLNASAC